MPLRLSLLLCAALAAEAEPVAPAPAVRPEVIVTLPTTIEPGAAAAGAAAFAAASPWELGTSVGGGWDSNPLALDVPVGSQFGAARVWLAREVRASGSDVLWLQVRYGGTRFTTLPEADLDRVEASVEWGHRLGPALTLRAVGSGAVRLAGDPARSGWDAGGRALARLRLAAPIALRAGGGYVRREARDPAYSTATTWLDAGLDLSLWRNASGVARYTVEAGTDWLSAVGGTGGGGGGWRGGAGSGGTSGTAPTSRVSQGVSADVRQDLWGGLFVQAGYGVSRVRVAGTSFVEHQAVGEVGWSR